MTAATLADALDAIASAGLGRPGSDRLSPRGSGERGTPPPRPEPAEGRVPAGLGRFGLVLGAVVLGLLVVLVVSVGVLLT
ncbi:hypothetical protein [Desertihabitans brevis]|uniref:hypothetical protein n=1 Tax=Desertihabitans brevis TaxID=2268447 RepID=UPI001313DD9B|nr:hypothetical protein [Desertihabitans brevis]